MRAFLVLVGLYGLVGFVDAAAVTAADRPNVILIMTDDQGYGDLGATGNPLIRTPNIDAMARRSAQMERFYVSPVCAPTRACLMTGRYNYRTRAIDTYIGRAMMETEEVTIAEMLGAAGYATGIFGKWHLGDNYPLRAMDQGFQESFVIRGGGIGQPSDPPGGEGKYTDPILFHNGQEAPQTGYCTDVYFDAAMNWIETQHDSHTPFFAYIPTNAPHGPFDDVPEAEYAQYKKVDLGNDQFPQERGHRLPKKANQDKRARIYAMISNVDVNVGRLFEKLDALNITDNTLVIFMVDNGPNGMRYVAGMRGMKSRVHEGGVRSPFYVHWPARLKAGQSSDRIAAHIDVLPTLLDACEVPVPEGVQLDGRSVLPLLEGKAEDWPDRMIYIQAHRGNVPVRFHNFVAINQDWTLLNDSGFGREKLPRPPQFELYDMTADPLQMHNVVAEQADVAKQMRQAYETWFDDVSSTRADNYAPPRIHLGTPHENPVVLTRQDWRRTSRDSGWQPDSRGYWELFVATAGRYDVTVTYKPREFKETLSLNVGDKTLTAKLAADSKEHTFRDVELPAGDARLMVELTHNGKREAVRGPWQVLVSKQAESPK
ncbi:Arylsulfatase precursor [Symmachiella macrocystis]|uniref:Arylsulfatase n=1 Tax=Symmachiella macrocystis TaxID=2527985 RepID=A0A5C6B5Y2_9PLAN|nr:arylsulfatase [Symmachiella macrocystis]TWU07360.1 Arylsulfatase precursor [Symmachiella macrocystis]